MYLYDANLIILFVLGMVILLWYYYILTNAYHIKIKSLTPCYYTFIFHCLLLAIHLVMTIIDILATPDSIFRNTIACGIYGRTKFVCYNWFTFSIILFSWFKVQLYRSVSNIVNDWEFIILKIVIYYGFIDIALGLALCEAKLEIRGDLKRCLQFDGIIQALSFARFLWLTIIFYWMVRIFARSKDVIELIPMLRHQIDINSKWVPILFFTTWCLHFCIWLTATILEYLGISWVKMDFVFTFRNLTAIDLLLNNIIMYKTIYGSNLGREESIDLCYTGGVEMEMDGRTPRVVDLDDLVWVSLPSCHPMKFARVVTEEMHIQDYVVNDPKRIAIFQKHQEASFYYPSCIRTSNIFRQFIKHHEREHMKTVTRSRTPQDLEQYLEEIVE